MTTKNDIEKTLWKSCDTFRGKIDSSRYKDYILSMLFVKYLSDVTAEKRGQYSVQYNGDKERIARAMSRERFAVEEDSSFDYLYQNRNAADIGQKINVALAHIEVKNATKLRNVFRAIDFNSQVDFGNQKDKNAILKNLLEDFAELDLRPSQLSSADIIGDAYEYMIANFASDAGKKGGEFLHQVRFLACLRFLYSQRKMIVFMIQLVVLVAYCLKHIKKFLMENALFMDKKQMLRLGLSVL